MIVGPFPQTIVAYTLSVTNTHYQIYVICVPNVFFFFFKDQLQRAHTSGSLLRKHITHVAFTVYELVLTFPLDA